MCCSFVRTRTGGHTRYRPGSAGQCVRKPDEEQQGRIPRWDEAALEALLRLDPVPGEPDRFVNPRLSLNMSGKLFGGQFIANTLTAAMRTAAGKAPRMFQGVFLRPGHADLPLELQVERVQDGTRLTHRRVRMIQDGRVIFSAQVYLDAAPHDQPALHEVAARHLRPAPEHLADLDALREQYRQRLGPEMYRRLGIKVAVQVRPVRGAHGLIERSDEPRLALWMKPSRPLSPDPLLHYAAVAYMSDYWLCWPTRSPHMDGLMDPGHRMFSLDHALWFHAAPDADDWLLYEVESPQAGNGYGLGRGSLYRRDGRLIASAAQQALLT
jgi:acyl-CoA thioesterase II